MTESQARSLFLAAAIFNVSFGIVAVISPELLSSTLGLPPVSDYLMTQVSGLTVACLGGCYWIISRDLSRRDLVVLGAVGKVLAPLLFLSAWRQGRIGAMAMAAGAMDWVFAAAFLVFLRSDRAESSKVL